MKFYSCLRGCGAFLPKKCLTNDDLAKVMDTSDEWIFKRTGIKSRYVSEGNEETSALLASEASRLAVLDAGIDYNDIDMIICATVTPDYTFPSNAARIQNILGIKECISFDVSAACSGFVYALSIVDKFIKTGTVKNALVIGAEVFSKIVDWRDRSTSVLFGDGAGAFVISASSDEGGILYSKIGCDADYFNSLRTTGGVGVGQKAGYVTMDGKEVFKFASLKMTEMAREIIEKYDVDYILPHQANIRIIDLVASNLGVNLDKFIISIQDHANTSAASIPIAFDKYYRKGVDFSGKNVLMLSIGAGFTYGAVLLRC